MDARPAPGAGGPRPAILVSSHLLAEMEQLADDLIIIAAGRLIAQGTVASVIGSITQASRTLVRTPQVAELRAALGGWRGRPCPVRCC